MVKLDTNDRGFTIKIRLKENPLRPNERFHFEVTNEFTRKMEIWESQEEVFTDGILTCQFNNNKTFNANTFGILRIYAALEEVVLISKRLLKQVKLHFIDTAAGSQHQPTSENYLEPNAKSGANEFMTL